MTLDDIVAYSRIKHQWNCITRSWRESTKAYPWCYWPHDRKSIRFKINIQHNISSGSQVYTPTGSLKVNSRCVFIRPCACTMCTMKEQTNATDLGLALERLLGLTSDSTKRYGLNWTLKRGRFSICQFLNDDFAVVEWIHFPNQPDSRFRIVNEWSYRHDEICFESLATRLLCQPQRLYCFCIDNF